MTTTIVVVGENSCNGSATLDDEISTSLCECRREDVIRLTGRGGLPTDASSEAGDVSETRDQRNREAGDKDEYFLHTLSAS